MSYRIDSVTLNILNPVVGQTLVASVAPYGATATITWYRDDDDIILTYGATYTVQADTRCTSGRKARATPLAARRARLPAK